MPFQLIYLKALAEPAIGFEASSKFQRAMFNCPRCNAWVYIRLRNKTRTALGATCTKCPWLTTHLIKPSPPPAPPQLLLWPHP